MLFNNTKGWTLLGNILILAMLVIIVYFLHTGILSPIIEGQIQDQSLGVQLFMKLIPPVLYMTIFIFGFKVLGKGEGGEG